MKKTAAAACALAWAVSLCACAPKQPGKADVADVTDVTDAAGGERDKEETGAEVTEAASTASAEGQMQGLMLGELGGIGLGFLVCVLPGQEGEDYRLCFFKEDSIPVELSVWDVENYSLEMADYVFPDVRENNASVGRFAEIYFFDTVTIGEDRAAGLAVVAAYDTDSGTCYDTRIYRWDGAGYTPEETLMQEFNQRYSQSEDYPAEELYRLSSGGA